MGAEADYTRTDHDREGTSGHRLLAEVCGDLVLAALCVGQFRAPCQIEEDFLLVRVDEALTQALIALGLRLRMVEAPFTPAPIFAPDQTVIGTAARVAAARRQVHTHISRSRPVDEGDDDEEAVASNA